MNTHQETLFARAWRAWSRAVDPARTLLEDRLADARSENHRLEGKLCVVEMQRDEARAEIERLLGAGGKATRACQAEAKRLRENLRVLAVAAEGVLNDAEGEPRHVLRQTLRAVRSALDEGGA